MFSVRDAVFIPQRNFHVADTSGAAGFPSPGSHCDAAEPAGTSNLYLWPSHNMVLLHVFFNSSFELILPYIVVHCRYHEDGVWSCFSGLEWIFIYFLVKCRQHQCSSSNHKLFFSASVVVALHSHAKAHRYLRWTVVLLLLDVWFYFFCISEGFFVFVFSFVLFGFFFSLPVKLIYMFTVEQ